MKREQCSLQCQDDAEGLPGERAQVLAKRRIMKEKKSVFCGT